MPPTPDPSPPAAEDRRAARLAQIETLQAEGVLTAEAAQAARRKLLDDTARPQGPPRRLLSGVAVFVLLFGIAGYIGKGNHAGWNVAPGDSGQAAAETAQLAQIEEMVAGLEARLKTQPDDADGWQMLARSYTAQGRVAEALPAWKRVAELRPKDAQALADVADGIAMAQGRSLAGEPEKLALRALEIDPDNLKALVLAGTAAFNREDARGAAVLWERALKVAEPGADFTLQLQGALTEARQRAGLPPLAAASAASPTPATPTTQAAATQPRIAGRVSLAAAARAKVSPDDTVFIFARAPGGSRMPLAILRHKVSDLPLDFVLDDSLAMSPAARLSSASQVVVGARISRSGNAMPQPGDWQTLSAPVALGTQDLKLEIGDLLP